MVRHPGHSDESQVIQTYDDLLMTVMNVCKGVQIYYVKYINKDINDL